MSDHEWSMSQSALYGIVLLSAVAHASWNAMVKSSGDRLLMLAAIRFVGLIMGIIVAAAVPLPSLHCLPFLLGAAAIHYLYYMLMLQSYRIGDMSQVYPIARGIAPLLVFCLGALLADEVLSYRASFAVGLLSAGIVALALSGQHLNYKAVGFALGTGIAISGYSFLSGLGIRRSGSPFGYIAWLEIMTGLGMASIASVRRGSRVVEFVRTQWRPGLIAGLLSVVGYSIVLWAMSQAAMAPVIALCETSVVFAALIGSVFLGEGFAGRRVAAAVAVVIGIVLLGTTAK